MNFAVINTEIFILALGLFAVVMDLILPRNESHKSIGAVLIFSLTAWLLYMFTMYTGPFDPTLGFMSPDRYFTKTLYIVDNYALFFKQLFIVAVIFTMLFASDYVQSVLRYKGEFYAILMLALLGMCVLASANDFLTLFIGLELMTISFYILVGARMSSKDSSEAAVKYLIVGSVSTAVMLYGISLVYGSVGSIQFFEVCRNPHLFYPTGIVGITLIMVGFFFKLSIIPFHMWAPDVYQGAPTPVTALLAMGSKAAGIAAFMRALYVAFPMLGMYWLPILSFLAAICMVFGNIMAIKQRDVKRMLAYSSIAQAGYMMVGIIAADVAGMKAVMFYAMLYVFANVGAFAVLSVVEAKKGSTSHDAMSGLSQSAPVLAAVMTISLLSMAGIPPTAGFAGKLYLFTAVVDQGYLWLAFVGFVMSMISVYYYLLVAKAMYLGKGDGDKWVISGAMRAAVVLSVVATILFGVWPEKLAELTNLAASTFLQ
ncbi:MAG: NADH-quinone oxidoreductase subunit N [Anaerovibrio sp.]|nr:NADH-quinone oxidoreductase subunit N [Selenomonadaceae bacterium]MDD6397558.1 NADH-quinone oxidoreductase subunit N [Selenomonadaceae bacterium]MDY6053812.1 NADH-quinone oxidoreductase subunit N [Anaerovibrio sp.]